jgi:hypothetical protein
VTRGEAEGQAQVCSRRNTARVVTAIAHLERHGCAMASGLQNQGNHLHNADQHTPSNQDQAHPWTPHKLLQRFDALDSRDVFGTIVTLETLTGFWLLGHHSFDSSITVFLLAALTGILSKIVELE